MFFRRNLQFLAVLSFSLLVSCKAYKQDILFQMPDDQASIVAEAIYEVEKNYMLQPNDWIEAQLFYRDGEQLINFNYREEGQIGNNSTKSERTAVSIFDTG